uniref:G-protein coupled receptors family 1 profile domain-containing protein n=1 Tax=Knipowitschia caucasica TaxID=637954 RepID=A0AAV2JG31_KNICA
MDPSATTALQANGTLHQLSTLSPVIPRVVSIVTSLVSATTEGIAVTQGNRSDPRNDLSTMRHPPTPSVLSAVETNSILRGIAVAAQALILLSIFLLSSLGNSAVVIVIIKHRQLRTVTNAFIMSLSLSDFLTAVLCLPFSFVMLFSKDGIWMFGDRFCVANGYYAIVRQPQAKIGRQKATQLLIAVWLTAVIFSLPCPGKGGGGGGGGGEVAMWACKNPAVFFCRDAQPDTATVANSVSGPKNKTPDTSL